MPSLKKDRRTPVWCARAKRNGEEYFLGHYRNKEEAQAAEKRFSEKWPPKLKIRGKNQRVS